MLDYILLEVCLVMVNCMRRLAISSVKSKKGLKIVILDTENQALKSTTNVVFKEVF